MNTRRHREDVPSWRLWWHWPTYGTIILLGVVFPILILCLVLGSRR